MPDFLADPDDWFYLALVVALGIAAYLGYQGRKEKNAWFPFGFVLVVLIVVVTCDVLYESPREQTIRKVNEMAAATERGDIDGIFTHVSDEFEYKGKSKSELRALAEQISQRDEWKGARVWEVTEVVEEDEKKKKEDVIRISFGVKPVEMNIPGYYCIATFQREADGEYRMTTFTFYNLVQKDNAEPEVIPNLG